MKVAVAFLVVCASILATDAIKCRRCIGASNLDECTFSVPCAGADEVCYMDEIITEQLTIEYNGGCRPRNVCTRPPVSGKKRAGPLIACAKCCDIDNNGRGLECNTKLCGIKASTTNSSQCYHCEENPEAGSSAVDKPEDCTTLTTCQTDEVCGSETYQLADHMKYSFSCENRALCTLLTQRALEERKRCSGPNPDPITCGIGKRQSGNKVCSACCADAVCNSESCEEVLDRLLNLWNYGVLDFKTLKTNGTIPTTSGSTTMPGNTIAG